MHKLLWRIWAKFYLRYIFKTAWWSSFARYLYAYINYFSMLTWHFVAKTIRISMFAVQTQPKIIRSRSSAQFLRAQTIRSRSSVQFLRAQTIRSRSSVQFLWPQTIIFESFAWHFVRKLIIFEIFDLAKRNCVIKCVNSKKETNL